MMESRIALKEFKSNLYYMAYYDKLIVDNQGNSPIFVNPAQHGRELISQYYSKKYKADIQFPGTRDDDLPPIL